MALAPRSDFLSVLWKNWWKYAILGIIDVEANFLVILAYKYTNLTSIQVSACTCSASGLCCVSPIPSLFLSTVCIYTVCLRTHTHTQPTQLLDSFTIATVMALSFVFLRVRYKVINVMGVSLALIGIVCLVLADLRGSRLEHGEREGEGGRKRER